jgi:hypothetical protein
LKHQRRTKLKILQDNQDEESQNHPMEPAELDPLFKVLTGKAVATVPVKRTLLLAFANKKEGELLPC